MRSARARRESYVGQWLPEPVVGVFKSLSQAPLGPEDQVTLDESVSMAVLVLLESLTPPERTALILHAHPRPAVNGSPGLVFEDDSGVVGVMAFTVAGGLITEIDFVVNPEKLRRADERE